MINSPAQGSRKSPLGDLLGKNAAKSPDMLSKKENKSNTTAPSLTLDWEDNHKKHHSD